MRKAKQLRRKTLVNIVDQIQAILWLDMNAHGDVWDPEKSWSPGSEFLDMIAEQLIEAGLRPDHLAEA